MPSFYLFIIILSLIIFFISLLRTDIGLIILILAMLFSPEFRAGDIPGRAVVLRIDDVFLLVIFLGWLAKMAINKELGFLKVTPLNRPIMAYSAICVLSTLLGALRGDVKIQQGIFYLLKYFEYFFLFFMVINNIRNVKQVKMLIFFLLATCFLVCVYAWLTKGGIEGRVTAPFEGKEGGEPNTFAGYLILMMALMIGLIIHTQSQKQRMLFLALLGFAFVPFILTLSRSGWLSFFPMYVTFLVIPNRFRPLMFMGLLVLIALMPVVAPERVRLRVKETFAPEKTYKIMGKDFNVAESAAARIDSWKYGFYYWSKRPFLGNGIPMGTVIDNQYMRVLSETGLVGFLAFLWIIRMLFALAWRVYIIFRESPFVQSISLGFIAGLVGLLMLSSSAAVFILIRIMEPFWFLAAIIVVLPEIIEKEKNSGSSMPVAGSKVPFLSLR